MHNNKTILDEAARSIRRTFVGSIAGTAGMLAVIGAAGAYGMPERLSAQSLSVALTTLHVRLSPMLDRVERARLFAADGSRNAPHAMPVPDHGEAAEPARAAAAPVAPAPATTPVVKPVEVAVAVAPPVATPVLPRTAMERPFDAAVGRSVLATPPVENAVVTASIPPVAAPPEAIETLKAPIEAPKPVAAPVEKPAAPAPVAKPEMIETPKAPVQVQAPAPAVALAAEPQDVRGTVELPKLAAVPLPHPKPPLSPAQRLDLHGKDYEKAEKCLAQAVYFEARNEPARGQQAVAQVVLNRVFSPYYPKDVCSVVYQNAHRHLSCQFTFACDGKSEAIRERGAWARAQRIAKETLEAKIWLPEVAKATHYHAAYVKPNWIRDMRVMVRHGLHTFYRPRNWGDGRNEPSWGAGAVKKPHNS